MSIISKSLSEPGTRSIIKQERLAGWLQFIALMVTILIAAAHGEAMIIRMDQQITDMNQGRLETMQEIRLIETRLDAIELKMASK